MANFPELLKTWRKKRRLSQLDLALTANVSARHVAFLETGRARPSPEMIERLGDALKLPLYARNQLLTHSGFATRYAARPWDAEDMAPIRSAVAHTLERHAPYPALAIDRMWTVIRMNAAARILFGHLAVGEGDSLLGLLTSERLPATIENWPEVAHHAAMRLRTESAAQGGVPELDAVAEVLANIPYAGPERMGPVVPTIFRAGSRRISLFATLAQFGSPEDLTLDDLKIELYFPFDAESEAVLKMLTAPA